MSKKKHPEHVNHERWLVSYADFITLLFAFFVVLFASSQSDKAKQKALSKAISSAFSNEGMFEAHSKTPSLLDSTSAPDAKPKPLVQPAPSAEKMTEDRVNEVIKREVARKHLTEGAITMHLTDDGLVISLREAGFFASGSADVRQDAQDIIAEIALALPNLAIHVEGHTDNVPIHTGQFATNWELSTARAATITRIILNAGIVSPKLISATGFAEFQPVADNASEEGRAKNRRVDVILLRRPTP
jgi:chemotaxis protein MotB